MFNLSDASDVQKLTRAYQNYLNTPEQSSENVLHDVINQILQKDPSNAEKLLTQIKAIPTQNNPVQIKLHGLMSDWLFPFPLMKFPHEILNEIFKYLDPKSMARLARSDKKLSTIVEEFFGGKGEKNQIALAKFLEQYETKIPQKKRLELAKNCSIHLKKITLCNNISLNTTKESISDKEVKDIVESCPHITNVYLMRQNIYDPESKPYSNPLSSDVKRDSRLLTIESLNELAHLKNLSVLSLRGCTFDLNLDSLNEFPHLIKLDLSDVYSLKEENFHKLINKSKNLQYLTLRDCDDRRVNDRFLSIIAKDIKQLRFLDLHRCKLVSDDGIKEIAVNFPNLETLSLRSTCITNEGINALIDHLSNLNEVDLSFLEISDDVLIKFSKKFGDLKSLSLCGFKIGDECLISILNNLPKLEALDLYLCENLTERGLKDVANNLINLKEIDLSSCKRISNIGTLLKNLKRLEVVMLGKCPQISDKDLAEMEALVNLKILNLQECKSFTNASAASLNKLPQLERVFMYGCSQINMNKFIEDLRPNIEIVTEVTTSFLFNSYKF